MKAWVELFQKKEIVKKGKMLENFGKKCTKLGNILKKGDNRTQQTARIDPGDSFHFIRPDIYKSLI